MQKSIQLLWFISLSLFARPAQADEKKAPLRFAMVGLNHDHAHGFLPGAIRRDDVALVGIVEPNQALADRYRTRYKLDHGLFYNELEVMLDQAKPQAVAVFTSTFGHRRVLEACAARGIDVMMEKPMALNLEDALAMAGAAKKGGIEVIINYETTWYASNHAAYELLHPQAAIGELRKVVVHDGHRGPKEIGCSAEFLEWLTDPVLNGGGALMDFGCYGADLMTWLMKGERPTSVTAVTQQIKPATYPKVEDEATIILTYPRAQCIIQASWNWPFDRKDMELYGQTGQILVPDKEVVRLRTGKDAEVSSPVPPLPGSEADSLSYLIAVVRGEKVPAGLSSVATNLVVAEILDAARTSAETGKRVDLAPVAPKIPE